MTYEEGCSSYFRNNVEVGDICIDIGAHYGEYTFLFSGLVGKEGKVFAFEPFKTSCNVIKNRIIEEGYKNIVVEQKAIWSQSLSGKLYSSGEDTSDCRVFEKILSCDLVKPSNGWILNKEILDCDLISLDDYFGEDIPKCEFMKIDSQGSELRIFKGMQRFLEKQSKINIIMECCDFLLKEKGDSAIELGNYLLKNGFSIQIILDPNHSFIPKSEILRDIYGLIDKEFHIYAWR